MTVAKLKELLEHWDDEAVVKVNGKDVAFVGWDADAQSADDGAPAVVSIDSK